MSSEFGVPADLVGEFSPKETDELVEHFKHMDIDKSGKVDHKEIVAMFKAIGETASTDEVEKLISGFDHDGDGELSFDEFCHLMSAHRKGSGGKLASAVAKHKTLMTVKGATGHHSYSAEEREAFTEHINNCLAGDEYLSSKCLPIDPASETDLFANIREGILLCKLINKAVPDTVDERALNFPKSRELNPWEIKENQNLCINAAKAIGCTVVNIHAADLVNTVEDHKEYLALGLLWQIVKVQLLGSVSLKNVPELVRLLKDGEELSELLRLPPEDVILRWINFHLRASGSDREVKNFGADLKDGEAYVRLLSQIDSSKCSTDLLSRDAGARAAGAIASAKAMGIAPFIKAGDITKGNKKLNLAFCAQIFNENPGLAVVTEAEKEDLGMAELVDDDDGDDSREERVFRMWMNSLNLPDDAYVHNLYEDLRDGLVLLKVIDAVEPGIVEWSKVARTKLHIKFKRVENCNYCVVLGKSPRLKFSLVGIGGVDIHDANKRLVLAFVWQLMRHHVVKTLAALSGGDGATIKDAEILDWANGFVASHGKSTKATSFKDKSLANGLFLLDLLASIEPRVVDTEIVTPGETDEDKMLNAKYILSVARKIGASVFLGWEDITEVKPKMLMTLVASLQLIARTHGSEK